MFENTAGGMPVLVWFGLVSVLFTAFCEVFSLYS